MYVPCDHWSVVARVICYVSKECSLLIGYCVGARQFGQISVLGVLGSGYLKVFFIFMKKPCLHLSGFDCWVSSGVFWSTFCDFMW